MWETEDNLESACLALEAYRKKIEGTFIVPSRISKKRSRQRLSGMDTPKRQKPGRKGTQTLSLDQLSRPSTGFTQVGDGPPQSRKKGSHQRLDGMNMPKKQKSGRKRQFRTT